MFHACTNLPQNVIPQPDISCTQKNIATPVIGVGSKGIAFRVLIVPPIP
jgi:hypothetical protein